MDKPSLSVIIVTHNNQSSILPCLESVTCSRTRCEIILVDNHSTDGTREAVDRFCSIHPHQPVRKKWNRLNFGFAAAVNIGLRHVRTPYTVLLGSDTEVFPDTFSSLIHALNNRDQTGMAAPQLITADGGIQPSCRKFPRYRDIVFELSGLPRIAPGLFRPAWKMTDFGHDTPMDVDQPEATCLMTRTAYICEVGGMDERFTMFFNDVDWCRRFRDTGKLIHFYPEAKVRHRKGSSIYASRHSMIWKSHQGCYRYFKKHAFGRMERGLNLMLGFLLILTAALRTLTAYFSPKRA